MISETRELEQVLNLFFFFFFQETHFILLLLQISRNITTNEMANVMCYSYLRGAGGRFRNPYDHGCRKNCSDFLINGYSEDLQASEDSAHSEGIGMVQMPRDLNLQNGNVHTLANGNGHIAINVNSSNANSHHHGHIHSSHCSHSNHSKSKTESAPLGLGLGLGQSSARSVTAP